MCHYFSDTTFTIKGAYCTLCKGVSALLLSCCSTGASASLSAGSVDFIPVASAYVIAAITMYVL